MPMKISINRAPVLTLWACVVAERCGHSRNLSLTLGKALAGYAAYVKAKSLGIVQPDSEARAKRDAGPRPPGMAFMGIPLAGDLAAEPDGKPINCAAVEKYLASKFRDGLEPAREAMVALAASLPAKELDRVAFRLYEGFRPEIAAGAAGWGKPGELDLEKVRGAR